MCFFPAEYIPEMVYAYLILNSADKLEIYNAKTTENSLYINTSEVIGSATQTYPGVLKIPEYRIYNLVFEL